MVKVDVETDNSTVNENGDKIIDIIIKTNAVEESNNYQ